MIETGLCFLLASVAGSIVYILMCGLQRLFCSDEYIKLNHMLWQGLVLIYMTVVVGGWLLNMWLLIKPGQYLWGAVSIPVRSVLLTISILWLVGALIQLMYYTAFRVKHNRMLESAIECDNRVNSISDEVRRALKIKKRVRVIQGYGLTVPELIGFANPIIYLPGNTSYTEEQIKSVIAHELYHYKHHDKWFRELAVIVHCINWFNPIIPWINRKMEYWDEICCDFEVIHSGIVSKEQYGESLFNLACKMVNWEQDGSTMLAIGMCKKKFYLKERIVRIMRYDVAVKQKVGLTILCMIIIMIVGGTTALAAGDSAAQVLQSANEKTVIEYEEKPASGETLVEQIEKIDLDEIGVDLYGQISPMANPSDQIQTTLTNGEWRSGYFKASAGQSIVVTVIASPSNINLKVGIYDPAGYLRYVQSSGTITHTFDLNQTGSYFVYVRNDTNVSVSINGLYQTMYME